uniref:Uncharacterized protein n=1 Tax=Heterorhabditis bacteriophora TaxID=37862 RepID=A0A1I7XQF7_HETBA
MIERYQLTLSIRVDLVLICSSEQINLELGHISLHFEKGQNTKKELTYNCSNNKKICTFRVQKKTAKTIYG